MSFSEPFIDDEIKALTTGLDCMWFPEGRVHLAFCDNCVFNQTDAEGCKHCDTNRIVTEASEMILLQSDVISKIRAILDNWEDIGYGMPIETEDRHE